MQRLALLLPVALLVILFTLTGCTDLLMGLSDDNDASPPPENPPGEGTGAEANTLIITLRDPAGDCTGNIDVRGMLMVIDKRGGAYTICLVADPVHPFQGSFRININLYNQDLGTAARYPSFFSDTMNDYVLPGTATMMTLRGSDSRLTLWREGARVFTNSLQGTGNPDGISLYRSAVGDPNGGFLDREDVIAWSDWAKPVIIEKCTTPGVTASANLTEQQCRQLLGL